ncbi:MAG: substrate-binding domain-containing protein [Actinobacteria bacterium]|nr:substrate-binding domain-containing protein [Actinomycetota bacterium]
MSGEIFITGSSTVEPISTAIGELFGEERGVIPDVEGPGTGDGFKKFCAGEADIADASRAIKDEEKAACESGGVEFVELKIGLDALTVLTSEKNSDVECLTLDDLYGLVGPESESVKKWSDASTLGATTSLPDADLKIFAPGTESGTYDSFWELAIKKKAEEKLGKDKAEEQKLRPDYGGLANDNEIVDSIASNPTSFGWVGFAFAEKAEGVSEIKIDGGDGCIEPSKETVADGTYPLSRPLFIYVNTAKLAESDALKAFVDYYLSDDGISQVDEVGYVSLDSAALEETRSAWADASK